MTILDFVRQWAENCPEKPAIIYDGSCTTYGQLYSKMSKCEALPIPLLGESWDGDFVLYTTGTTGKSKGVIISQRAVIANSENLIAGQGFSHNLVFIIAGAMDHLGSWSKIFPTLIQGGTLFILKDGMKSIESFFSCMDNVVKDYALPEETKFATFLVPSNIRIMLQFSGSRLAQYADRIDFIETGAAPMPHSDMLQLCELLPNTRLFNTYASTETGIVATYNYNDGRCLQGCLGHPLKHSTIFITEAGQIATKGPTMMSGYKDQPELTLSVMHDDTLFTADNGFIDEEGMLHILGRNDDIINIGGFKVSPVEVEDIAIAFPSVADCICISAPHPILGQSLKLLVALKPGEEFDKKAIARYINSRVDEQYKVPTAYQVVDKINRNQNGKLDRKSYRN